MVMAFANATAAIQARPARGALPVCLETNVVLHASKVWIAMGTGIAGMVENVSVLMATQGHRATSALLTPATTRAKGFALGMRHAVRMDDALEANTRRNLAQLSASATVDSSAPTVPTVDFR